MNKEIEGFWKEWQSVRGRTLKFLESVPKDKWTWKPHGLLGTFGMQVRHIGVSQRAYLEGIRSKKVEFSNKQFDKELESSKDKAIAWLKELDKELYELLNKQNPEEQIVFVDGVEGEHTVSLLMVLSYLSDHEFYHQGIFTCYGRLAGLGKFTFM